MTGTVAAIETLDLDATAAAVQATLDGWGVCFGAGAGHAEGDGLADAGVGAGDERAAAVEAEGVAHRKVSIATISTSL